MADFLYQAKLGFATLHLKKKHVAYETYQIFYDFNFGQPLITVMNGLLLLITNIFYYDELKK